MKLIGFTNFFDDKYHDIDCSDVNYDLAWSLTVDYMKEKGLRWNGFYHQNGRYGTPYFDTEQRLCLSLRGWGSLMVDVLNIPQDENDKNDMRYCKWAWNWNEVKDEVYLYPDEPTFQDDKELIKPLYVDDINQT